METYHFTCSSAKTSEITYFPCDQKQKMNNASFSKALEVSHFDALIARLKFTVLNQNEVSATLVMSLGSLSKA
jgi:hypothetical protein